MRTARTNRSVWQHGTVSETYWHTPAEALLEALETSPDGLSEAEAARRLSIYGPNALEERRQATAVGLFLNQFRSPLVLILIFAALVSAALGEWVDASIVLAVVLGSTILGFAQEYTASSAVEKLRSQVTIKANVLRDGQMQSIPSEQVVPGDVVSLSAGSLIAADGVVLNTQDFFVNQAVLTGETFPVEKRPGEMAAEASLAERTNCVFMGTSVRSGTARAMIVETGKATVFGEIAERLSLRPQETEFERGIQRFGYLLTRVMLVMVVIVLALNILLKRPPVDSLLFALALAVGLTPELLPAIISVTLSHGAQQMAKRGVIVRRLNAIENFGSMDVLCTDKTGTLTEGTVHLDEAANVAGEKAQEVIRLAYWNAHYQTGLSNPLDDAILSYVEASGPVPQDEEKLAEIPYDFVRKRLSVIVRDGSGQVNMIVKGALREVLDACTSVHVNGTAERLGANQKAEIEKRFSDWSEQGLRVLGVASRSMPLGQQSFARSDECDLTFQGFLLFFDPPKKGVQRVLADLRQRGVQLKIITGDNDKIARHVAEAVNLPDIRITTGRQLQNMRDEALWHVVEQTTIFAEVDPNQKERLILAMKKTGHVVGYMGDGINDAPALHAADVSISVDTAVDVAKEAADFVLLRQDLGILREGIDEGRVTFANTLKYVLTTISANFGNMFSMAGASALLPFLPLLAPQILLNNFLSDIPATTIASDNVDPEWVEKPRRWDTVFIRDYMVLFGLVSSIFDFATFGVLLLLFRAAPAEFRTGWFIESLLSELVIALVVRTRHLFFRSRPGTLLLGSTVAIIAIALVLPYLPFMGVFGFVALPAPLMLSVVGLTGLYVIATEVAKKAFYARMNNRVL
jgi:P-type Mg2+ transporter